MEEPWFLKKSLSSLGEADITNLTKQVENEFFDRTLGSQEAIGRKIAGLATKNGGLLLVGQDDFKKGGKIEGVSEEDFAGYLARAMFLIKPKPIIDHRLFTMKEGQIGIIRVMNLGDMRPCAYIHTFYIREGDATNPMDPQVVKQYHLRYGGGTAENLPTPATRADVDESELANYASAMSKDPQSIMESVSQEEHLNRRGVVVLCKQPDTFIEGGFIEIQRYAGSSGSPPNAVGAPIRLSKPARQMIEETARLILQNLPVEAAYSGAVKQTALPIPDVVVREAVTNAVAHRSYGSLEHILVRIYDDGFDISNPALITPEMWVEIQATHGKYHPNEGIHHFLNPVHVYEGRGEGIQLMRAELEKIGKNPPAFSIIGIEPSVFLAKISLAPATARAAKLDRLHKIIREHKSVSTTIVMKRLKISRVTAIKLLNSLASQGVLVHEGSTRSSHYVLKVAEKPKP